MCFFLFYFQLSQETEDLNLPDVPEDGIGGEWIEKYLCIVGLCGVMHSVPDQRTKLTLGCVFVTWSWHHWPSTPPRCNVYRTIDREWYCQNV